MSRSPLDIDDLVEHWTLLPDELDLVVRLHEPSRLAFAVWLKFYTRHGRFPRGRGEVHDDAVTFVARQLKVSAGDLGLMEWSGRTAERHRATIRGHLGFRECSTADALSAGGSMRSRRHSPSSSSRTSSNRRSLHATSAASQPVSFSAGERHRGATGALPPAGKIRRITSIGGN